MINKTKGIKSLTSAGETSILPDMRSQLQLANHKQEEPFSGGHYFFGSSSLPAKPAQLAPPYIVTPTSIIPYQLEEEL